MEVPFIGPTFEDKSLDANAQRCINMYLESYEDGSGQKKYSMYNMPGYSKYAILGAGPVRGMDAFGNNLYAVAKDALYRITPSKVISTLGTLNTSTGRVSLAYNGTHISVVDGVNHYWWDTTTSSFHTDSDSNFLGATHHVFVDGFFVFNKPNSQVWYFPELSYTATGFNALDFASAEGKPDNILSVVQAHNILWFFGERTTEPWQWVGGNLPWTPYRPGFMEYGTAAAHTPLFAENTIYWLSRNHEGDRMFMRADGFKPTRVSPFSLEQEWQSFETVDDAFTFSFQMLGHTFIALVFPDADRSYIYDTSQQFWYDWERWNDDPNKRGRHRANCVAYFDNKHIIGDYINGTLYKLDPDVWQADGDPIRRVRRGAHIHAGDRGLFVRNFHIRCETGVGNEAGSDPQLMLRISRDRGRTWGYEKRRSLGKRGEYALRPLKFPQLGWGRNFLFEASVVDNCKTVFRDGYVNAEPGDV